jgi:adenylylsulfate kinase-like enzyme
MGNVEEIARNIVIDSGCKTSSVVGTVVWITGLSGAGKTTVSKYLKPLFEEHGLPVIQLDGDELRRLFAAHVGHLPEERLKLAEFYAALCQSIAASGVHVICATISMFHSVRDWNRSNIAKYVEVYLRVPSQELKARDPKGLYRLAANQKNHNMVGVESAWDEPRTPDLIIDNFGAETADRAASKIWQFLVKSNLVA